MQQKRVARVGVHQEACSGMHSKLKSTRAPILVVDIYIYISMISLSKQNYLKGSIFTASFIITSIYNYHNILTNYYYIILAP